MATRKKADGYRCIHISEKRLFQCKFCLRIVSTKDNILKHLCSQHGLSPFKGVKKLYLKDDGLPVPRSTAYKRKQASKTLTFKDQAGAGTSENVSDNFFNGVGKEHCQSNIEIPDLCNSDSSHEQTSDEATDSDKSNYIFSSEDSLFSDSQSSDSDENEEHYPVYASDAKTKALNLLQCFKRHNLTASACKDVLKTVKDTVKDILPENEQAIHSLLSYEKLLSHIPSSTYKKIHYCSVCECVTPNNGNSSECNSENCRGRIKSFMIANVADLLCNMLKAPGIFEDILMTKQRIHQNENDTKITDIHSGKMYKVSERNLPECESIHLTGTMNTDGVNLYSSSKVELWPVFMAINELSPELRFSRENLLVLGLWQGKGKPPFKQFLAYICQEINILTQNGIQIEMEEKLYVLYLRVLCVTMDLPAKAAVLNMTLYNGREACILCEETGVTVAQGRGHCRSYPYRTENELFPIRSHDNVIESMRNASAIHRIKGFKGLSGLACLQDFDLVNGIVPDYMHAVLLGIVKTILNKWFSPTESGKDHFIGKELKRVSEKLLKIKPPYFIERLPRDLEKNYAHLKATELQTFLLYYSIPCLHGIHHERYLQHFALLSEAIFILLGDEITEESLFRSKQLLNQFYRQFAGLYGQGSSGLNVHNVCVHMPSCVENLGPIWSWSCFAFEDGNSMILKSVHGTGDVVKQSLRNQEISMHIRSITGEKQSNQRKTKVTLVAQNCDIFGSVQTFRGQPSGDILHALGVESSRSLRKVQRICVNGNKFYSAEYSRMKKRTCHAVLYSTDKLGLVHYFILVNDTNKVYAVMKKMILNSTSWLHTYEGGKHLKPVQIQSHEIDVVPVEQIMCTLVFMDLEVDAETAIVGTRPNKHGHAVFK